MPSSYRGTHPEIPWREMAAMRDRLIHGYFGVDLIFVWETVKSDIPSFIPLFQHIVDEIK
ncbi:HepT-like ribonuclease domain-containing protein [Methanolobus vulcani]|uniref:HepT-like ribonuclease domain-containing protein n=1 Tax=Methanolobus vulcani TaxID=38026 RepID=UPI0030839278